MNIVKKSLLAAAIFGVSTFAFAEAPSFNYLGLGWSSVSGDSADLTGYELSGSYEISDKIFLETSFSDGQAAFGAVEADATDLSFGIGYVLTESDTTNTYVSLNSNRIEVNSIDVSGYTASTGVRSNVADSLQLGAKLSYSDTEIADSDSVITVSATVDWYASPNWTFGTGLGSTDGDFSLTLGTAFYY